MSPQSGTDTTAAGPSRPLSLDEYTRYGRQMILPGWGLPGQLALKNARVAVVGAGGLGCPALQYLAGAGVGSITIIDHDTVSLSNLHRQILHTAERVGMNKAESACLALAALNPHITLRPIPSPLTPSTALPLLASHTLLLDCTDRPLTRYLLSDTGVRLGIPLVSGAAIASSGQWAVYGGSTPAGTRRACYRCVWPEVLDGGADRCEEVGVWGSVTGMVGSAMAGEAVRVLLGLSDEAPAMHFLRLEATPLVRTVKMRGPRPGCLACGEDGGKALEGFDYAAFCAGPSAAVMEREGEERVSPKELKEKLDLVGEKVVLVDTRPEVEFGICSLPGSINVPLSTKSPNEQVLAGASDVVFVCRRGNDSLLAARELRDRLGGGSTTRIRDLRGGLEAWSREVDPDFPIY